YTTLFRSGGVGANQRREGESALPIQDSIPLPASDQLVHKAGGAARESLSVSKGQLIAVARVELVGEAEAGNPSVQAANIRSDQSSRLVFTGGGKDGRIVIHHFAPTVIRPKSESPGSALDQRDIQRMIAAGAPPKPCNAGGHITIRAITRRSRSIQTVRACGATWLVARALLHDRSG